jgi:hypothetical protein
MSGTKIVGCYLVCRLPAALCSPFLFLKPPLGPVDEGSGYRYMFLGLVLFLPFAIRMPTIHIFAALKLSASLAALYVDSLTLILVCAGTHISFKSSPSSAYRLSYFGIVGFLPGYTLSNAVRLLSESVIMTVLQCMCFECAFKIAYISALKIVVSGSNRYFTAQPTFSFFN